jgi:NADH-quinone oxidoreductase subunit L
MAMMQNDIKRVLAYSTVSQLGYMFMGCGVAAYSAGVFHLITHAFFKALLFLAAGSVIHALGGEQDMRVMGGLRRSIPITFWTMTAAVVAISGFPPFSGFVSKDEILYDAFVSGPAGKIFWAVGLLTAGLTAFYMFRLWYMTFLGESRASHGTDAKHAHHPHESPWVMLIPLIILATLSVIGGALGWPESLGGNNWISHFLAPAAGAIKSAPGAPGRGMEIGLAALSSLVAFSGWYVAHLMYYSRPELPAKLTEKFRGVYTLVFNKYWVDELYGFLFVAPTLFVARYVLGLLIDRGIIDGGTLGVGYTAQGLGAVVARIQSGNIRSYAGWLALFAALLIVTSYFGWTTHFWMH